MKKFKPIILIILLILGAIFIGSKFFKKNGNIAYNPKVSKEYKKYEKEMNELIANALVESPEDVAAQNQFYFDELENQHSDIKGMTKLDKYNAGLNPEDGADTDNDGLTDKAEIEIYGTDPKKKSTAGDLYTDGYKVEHDMDLNTVYDYDGKLIAEGNKCNEVTLYIDDIDDFSAIVEDVTGQWQFSYAESTSAQWLDNLNILKEYRIYNYSGCMDIKLTDIVKESGVSANNICAMFVMSNYANGWNQMLNQNFNYKVEDDVLKIEDRIFASGPILILYEDTKLAKNNVNINPSLFEGIDGFSFNDGELLAENSNVHEEGGDILITFNLFSALTRGRPSIKYTSTGNPEEDAYTIDACIKIAKWLSDADLDNARIDPLEINSSHCKQISPKMYGFLDGFYRTFFPDFVSANWKNIITIIDTDVVLGMIEDAEGSPREVYTYKNGMRYEYDKEKGLQTLYDSKGNIIWSTSDIPKEGFDIHRDRLPFGNFCTDRFQDGHCAGISLLTCMANNAGTIEQKGFYESKKYKDDVISWDLLNTEDEDNKKLVDEKILIHYKDKDFVNNHTKELGDMDGDGKSDGHRLVGLSKGELEFVNMIEAYQYYVWDLDKKGKRDGISNYDYELINEMIKRLDEDKILCCSLCLYQINEDHSYEKNTNEYYSSNAMYYLGSHAINIYDYKKIDDKTIHFYVYDSNLPREDLYQTPFYTASSTKNGDAVLKKCNMYITVTKKESNYDHKETFEFMYQPLPESYCGYFSTNQGLYEMNQSYETNQTKAFMIPDKKHNMTDYSFVVWDETGEVISNKY